MVEGGEMPIGQYWEILEELSARKNDLASTRKELEEAKPYMDAIRQRHNGYCPEMQKVGIKEPKSPKAALDSLIGEAEALGLAESKEYRKELETLRGKVRRYFELNDTFLSSATHHTLENDEAYFKIDRDLRAAVEKGEG